MRYGGFTSKWAAVILVVTTDWPNKSAKVLTKHNLVQIFWSYFKKKTDERNFLVWNDRSRNLQTDL